MSLRKAFTVIAVVLVALAVTASAASIVLRSELHAVATGLDNALESVRVAKQLRIELLEADRIARARTPATSSEVGSELYRYEGSLFALLETAAQLVETADEARLVSQARERITSFLASARGATSANVALSADAAHAALKELVEYNLALARSTRERAYQWDRLAGIITTAQVALVVSAVIALLFWARRQVLGPLVEIRTGIVRYSRDKATARLVPRGPLEVREVASAFNAVAEELAAQRSERMAMLGGVAHDLRNPLSVLRMATRQFSSERPLPPERRLRELLTIVDRQVTRLDRMLGDFLDASRIEAGTLELHLERADVRSTVEHVVALYRAGQPRRDFALAAPDEPLFVRCDPARIEQALGNLVSNALKYSPEGSRVEVSISESRDRKEVVVAVADHGVGLSAEEQRRVFEPFARVGSLRTRVPGVGLGLAMASKIISAHDGCIDVHSEPGRGARFEIRLPVYQGTGAGELEPQPPARGSPANAPAPPN